MFRLTALLILASSPAWTQSAPRQEDAISKQRNAASAMQESLAKQRASVEKQVGQPGSAGFFQLPRAAGLGTNAPVAAVPAAPIPPICDPLPEPQVDSLVSDAAEKQGLDADLLRGVMKQESGFRPCAVSSKGAIGLMQLMPATAEQFGLQNPFDAVSNVDAGARFLKQLLGKYDGDISKALGAYNAGPAKVDAAGGVPAIPETMDYVRQILAALPIH